MAKSCKGLAMELKCLSETYCIKVQKRPYKERAGENVPNITSECVGLRETYFNCKRGQLGFKMFLGVTATVTNWDAEGTSCSLVLEDNPLVDFCRAP